MKSHKRQSEDNGITLVYETIINRVICNCSIFFCNVILIYMEQVIHSDVIGNQTGFIIRVNIL